MPILLDDQPSGLSDFADLCQVIIAGVNLYFVGYLLFYQLRKDIRDKTEKEEKDKNDLRLQWFKELIVQPNLSNFFAFFDNVSNTSDRLKTSNLSDQDKSEVLDDIKTHLSLLRKQFIDVLLSVNNDIHFSFKTQLDELIDSITNDAFADTVDLTNSEIYNIHITDKILGTKNTLIERIINYKGN